MKKFFDDYKYAASWALFGILILALVGSLFLATKIVGELRQISRGSDIPVYNSINVSHSAEVVAVADIASFNFSVNENADTVEEAQKTAAEKINNAINHLKSENIEDKDIKTVSYNINPKYEWRQGVCNQSVCQPGNSVMIGYEVSQNISVKVRETEKAGAILSAIGALGISNVSGLQFTIDDLDELKAEARAEAIAGAMEEADKIAKDLGVKIVRIIGYYEESDGIMPFKDYAMVNEQRMVASSPAPQLPMGENTVSSRVNVTFEIK